MLVLEPLAALAIERTSALEEFTAMSSTQEKLKTLQNLELFKQRVEGALQKKQKLYGSYSMKSVKHLQRLEIGDWIYIDNSLNLAKRKTGRAT